MLVVETISKIRRAFFQEKKKIKDAAKAAKAAEKAAAENGDGAES